jgi:hypothetical protein
MQSRIGSLFEAGLNIAVGYGVAVLTQIVVLPVVLGVTVPLSKNLLIGAIFTVVSLIRQYALRRVMAGRFRAKETPDVPTR